MLKQFQIDFAVTKEKYMALIYGTLSLIFAVIDRAAVDEVILKPDEIKMTMSFAGSFAALTVFSIITLFFVKQYNLKKYKLEEWYHTQPKNGENVVLSDIIFVIFTHLIGFVYWMIFNVINQSPENISSLTMVFAVSLVLHAVYILLSYKKMEQLNLIMTIIYTAAILFVWMFHSMLVRNDHDCNLNLRAVDGWNFYLYQLPFIVLALGIAMMIAVYPIVHQRFNKSHFLN